MYEWSIGMSCARTTAVAFALLLALAVPAQAGKPTIVEDSRCEDIAAGVRLCTQSRTTLKAVVTKSQTRLTQQTRIRAQFTTPDCRQDEFLKTLERTVTRSSGTQSYAFSDRVRITSTCVDPEGAPTDCVQTTKLRIVNGVVLVDRADFVCRPRG